MNRPAELQIIDTEIAARRDRLLHLYDLFAHPNACGLHYVALPTTSVELGRVVKRQQIYAKETAVNIFLDGNLVEEARWRFGEFHDWRPALRAVNAAEESGHRLTRFSLTTGGLCEFTYMVGKPNTDFAPFYARWFASSMGLMLNWIDRIRREGGVPDQEYALAPTFVGRGKVGLESYGKGMFSDSNVIPEGPHVFPLYPVGSREGFDEILARFNEDFWNAVHVDPSGLTFHLLDA